MAALTEERIYEAFGLGAKVQEPAAPATKENSIPTDEGAKAQDPAAPASVDTPDPNPTAQPAVDTESLDDGADGTGADQKPLTEDQRRVNAARRRQQEQKAAVDKAVAEALEKERQRNQQQWNDFFAKSGLKNTFTGKPITTMEEHQQWQQQVAQAQLERELKSGKLTSEGLALAIGNHPLMQQAQALIDSNVAAEAAKQQAEDQIRIDAEIAKIHEIDPSINSPADFLTMANADQFKALVDKGYSFEHAYFIVNRERIDASRAEAVRQQAMLNARGKEHLVPSVGSRGEGALPVPADVMSLYRQLNPGMSDAQIIAHYNKVKKK